MKKAIKYGLIAGGLYLAYRMFSERQGTVTVGPIQQYSAAWGDYWQNQRSGITDFQKTVIQNEISKGNITFV